MTLLKRVKKMTEYVNLEMTLSTYNKILDFLVLSAKYLDNYYTMSELVHLIDYIEDTYQKDKSKINSQFERTLKYDELFRTKELYHYKHFYNVEEILDKYINSENISEKNKFYLVCELIDFLKENKNDIE